MCSQAWCQLTESMQGMMAALSLSWGHRRWAITPTYSQQTTDADPTCVVSQGTQWDGGVGGDTLSLITRNTAGFVMTFTKLFSSVAP